MNMGIIMIGIETDQLMYFRFHAASYCHRKEGASDLGEKYQEVRIYFEILK